MKIRRYNQDFAFIDNLIRRKATGTPQQLGIKIGKSTIQVKRIMMELKEDGFPIKYCRSCSSYYYTEPVTVKLEIKVGGLDLINIAGGKSDFCFFNLNYINCYLTPGIN